jgi:hypothetical protein
MAMSSGDRFYQLDLRHRPALYGDLGSIIKVEGLVVGGEGGQQVLMLPSSVFTSTACNTLTIEEWTDFLQRSDSPEVLVGPAKAFHRKVRYEISGAVQQKIWVADGCSCKFCGGSMGEVQLTVDHFIPLELGGKNDTSNYITACRRCNKNKGSMDPKEWCHLNKKGASYEWYIDYLATRKIP